MWINLELKNGYFTGGGCLQIPNFVPILSMRDIPWRVVYKISRRKLLNYPNIGTFFGPWINFPHKKILLLVTGKATEQSTRATLMLFTFEKGKRRKPLSFSSSEVNKWIGRVQSFLLQKCRGLKVQNSIFGFTVQTQFVYRDKVFFSLVSCYVSCPPFIIGYDKYF